MNYVQINIQLTRDNDEKHSFSFNTAESKSLLDFNDLENLPDWVKLNEQQCPQCPFSADKLEWCPCAVELIELVERFPNLPSYEKLKYELKRDDLYMQKEMDAQNALAGIFFLRLTFSGCPIFKSDVWSWKYFSPATDLNNILFRRLAINLVCDKLSKEEDKDFSSYLHNEEEILQSLFYLKKRLENVKAIEKDAIFNAIVVLHNIITIIQHSGNMIFGELEKEIIKNI